jgi:TPR repeat protein
VQGTACRSDHRQKGWRSRHHHPHRIGRLCFAAVPRHRQAAASRGAVSGALSSRQRRHIHHGRGQRHYRLDDAGLDGAAFKWLQTAADKGNAFSQAEIHDAYADGKGGYEKNITTAITWYRKSADQKSAYAQRKLGLIYLNGTGGTQRDPATAYDYLKKATEAGDLIAQHNLGTMYQKGVFVKSVRVDRLVQDRRRQRQGRRQILVREGGCQRQRGGRGQPEGDGPPSTGAAKPICN